MISGSSSVGRATAFQAVGRGFEPRLPLCEHPAHGDGMGICGVVKGILDVSGSDAPMLQSQCSSEVEHFLGKEGVEGSIPFVGSNLNSV